MRNEKTDKARGKGINRFLQFPGLAKAIKLVSVAQLADA
jgi:hypothetical protein